MNKYTEYCDDEYMEFPKDFNKIIKKGEIPDSITFLIFGDDYNQKLKKNVLPISLTHLYFGVSYNQKIN